MKRQRQAEGGQGPTIKHLLCVTGLAEKSAFSQLAFFPRKHGVEN